MGPDAASGQAGRRALRRGQRPLLVALLTLIGFALVMALVLLSDTKGIDLRVTHALQSVRGGTPLALMQGVSWFGFDPQVFVIEAVIIGGIFLARLRLEAAFALLAALGSLAYVLIKGFARRPRPIDGIDGVIAYGSATGTSFPSGHVLNFVIFLGFLSYLIYTLLPPRPPRTTLLAFLTALIVLVGPSRIYLGQHWFTDTLASYLLGTTILIAVLTLYRLAKARQVGATTAAEALPAR
jgi:membrane-associated phospholipid phosphatase